VSVEFWLTTLVVIITPGTGVLFTVAVALADGRRAGAVAAAGNTLAVLPHLAAAVSGAAVLLATSPVAFTVVKWLGVAYLLYMAWSGVRHAAEPPATAGLSPSAGRTVLRAVLVNLLNPKLTVFFLALLPQFVTPDRPGAVARMLGLGLVFLGTTFAALVGYAMAAAAVRDRIIARPAALAAVRRALAVSFVGLGVRLALTAR
jgi:threonine/homoserine/homoserine lactone efflux protein